MIATRAQVHMENHPNGLHGRLIHEVPIWKEIVERDGLAKNRPLIALNATLA